MGRTPFGDQISSGPRKMDENLEDEIRRLDVPRRAGRDQGAVSALSSSLLMKVTSGRAVGSQSKDFGGFGTASGSRLWQGATQRCSGYR